MLRPVARLLIAGGVPFRRQANRSESAYVEAAHRHFGEGRDRQPPFAAHRYQPQGSPQAHHAGRGRMGSGVRDVVRLRGLHRVDPARRMARCRRPATRVAQAWRRILRRAGEGRDAGPAAFIGAGGTHAARLRGSRPGRHDPAGGRRVPLARVRRPPGPPPRTCRTTRMRRSPTLGRSSVPRTHPVRRRALARIGEGAPEEARNGSACATN